ncbi:MAG TPA: glutathionylspermidine synthase family protein, partial [Candidatus Omnitrophota bacterium]|nr:glutathionylspermidine synthase family protein [Candidatus Omnitrophota bacterium]
MRRLPCTPRPDWGDRVESLGFDFHTIDGAIYWDERAYWHFTAAEIDILDDASAELHGLCLQAVEHAMAGDGLERLGITGLAAELARDSWRRREPHFYGRFDLAWTGDGPPKLLEYNADTPTSLFEAAVVQWQWLQDFAPEADQFNWIHEALVARWADIAIGVAGRTALHLACVTPHAEDEGTLRYLQATALEAGLATKAVGLADIGWNGRDFVDLDGQAI